MTAVEKALAKRGVPDLLISDDGERVKDAAGFEARREQIKKILSLNAYGEIPKRPDHLSTKQGEPRDNFCAGKASLQKIDLICTVGERKFSFPVLAAIPKRELPCPTFVHISHHQSMPNEHLPIEEIIDRGYAVLTFCYTDVATDDKFFTKRCAPYLCQTRRRKSAPGKIALWAWAAMRVMDYIESNPLLDKSNVAVIGHEKLGAVALLAGGFDERFKYVISNDSGCCGAALSRGKCGETPEWIADVYPYLMCPEWTKNVQSRENMGYDQNFLAALCVPRHLVIGSAELDLWSDPESEFLTFASVMGAYRLYGKESIMCDEPSSARAVLDMGHALYHVRHGERYLSREDWNVYMDYIDKHIDD